MRISDWSSDVCSSDLISDRFAAGDCAVKPYRPSPILGQRADRRRELLYPLVRRAACEARLPVGLIDALIMQESRYNPSALSPKGAFGLGQLMQIGRASCRERVCHDV